MGVNAIDYSCVPPGSPFPSNSYLSEGEPQLEYRSFFNLTSLSQ